MKVIKKEMVFHTASDDGIKGKLLFSVLNFSLLVSAERDILKRFDHPFIMKLEFAFQDSTLLYMVMEFVNGGELFFHMHRLSRKPFDEERAKFYAA